MSPADVTDKVSMLEVSAKKTFRHYRVGFITEKLDTLKRENHAFRDGADYVTASAHNTDMLNDVNICRKCGFVFPNEGSACPTCHYDLKFHDNGYDPYYRTPCQLGPAPVQHLGEPILVNPSSKEAVKEVLLKIRDEGLKTREWLPVWSDGVPYIYGNQVKDEEKGFEDILLRAGMGHFEMNFGKAILNIAWPFIEQIVHELGFRSPKAKEVVKKGANHHRTRQILGTLLDAVSLELLFDYVKTDPTPSAERYLKWVDEEVENPSYMFLFDLCFTYLLAFHLLTESVRKNHAERMLAAQVTGGTLFYVRHHPKYRELILRDLIMRAQCLDYSKELYEFLQQTQAFSVTGAQNRGQSPDFLHEEVPNR